VTKPEIIGSERSSYTRIVRMVCEEKGIDYDLTEALLGAAEIRALHPFAKMPVLRLSDLVMSPRRLRPISIARSPDRSSFRRIRVWPVSPSNGCR
jgi:hypothetical protein